MSLINHQHALHLNVYIYWKKALSCFIYNTIYDSKYLMVGRSISCVFNYLLRNTTDLKYCYIAIHWYTRHHTITSVTLNNISEMARGWNQIKYTMEVGMIYWGKLFGFRVLFSHRQIYCQSPKNIYRWSPSGPGHKWNTQHHVIEVYETLKASDVQLLNAVLSDRKGEYDVFHVVFFGIYDPS